MKDIHKTPLEIQGKLDERKSENGKSKESIDFLGDLDGNIERHQFDWDVFVASTLAAHMDTNASTSQDRRHVLTRSLINDSPFQVKTMISTRSVVKKVDLVQSKKFESNIYEAVKSRFGCLEEED